jgi:mono/diheme cytochrome c family protein
VSPVCAVFLTIAVASTALHGARAADTMAEINNTAINRGGGTFRAYCVLCHGAEGRGDGKGAPLYAPRPANLVLSPYNDIYKEQIIRGGGQSMGRSEFMPMFNSELSNEQIRDLVAYLASINGRSAKKISTSRSD